MRALLAISANQNAGFVTASARLVKFGGAIVHPVAICKYGKRKRVLPAYKRPTDSCLCFGLQCSEATVDGTASAKPGHFRGSGLSRSRPRTRRETASTDSQVSRTVIFRRSSCGEPYKVKLATFPQLALWSAVCLDSFSVPPPIRCNPYNTAHKKCNRLTSIYNCEQVSERCRNAKTETATSTA